MEKVKIIFPEIIAYSGLYDRNKQSLCLKIGGVMDIDKTYLRKIVIDALEEDFGDGDITCDFAIPKDKYGKAQLIAKEAGVLAGFNVVEMVFYIIDDSIEVEPFLEEGEFMGKGDVIGEIRGPYAKLLSGERTALNFLQQLSGVASYTNELVKKISHTDTKLLDTRKTIPGLRELQKYAVRKGGGMNHRMGLYDMILLKENHIAANENIVQCVKRVLEKKPHVPIEVEVRNFDELKSILKLPVDRIMLDNFTPAEIRAAINLRKELESSIEYEASGGIDFSNIIQYAETGVEYISSGAITHSAPALDITMLIEARG